MREIKFRAWDNVMDRMYHVGEEEDIVFELTGGNFIAVDITEDEDEFATLHHLEYMQYTGLKDKNGREIFEGDLFRWEEDAVGVIKYKDGSFYLETNIALPGDSVHAPGFYSPWLRVIKHELETELEIIGNIYENPELLEVAE